jgi:cytochrome c-type biogenesis protein CcmH/NrfG
MTASFWTIGTLGVFGLGASIGLLAALLGLLPRTVPRPYLLGGAGTLAALSVALLFSGGSDPAVSTGALEGSAPSMPANPRASNANAGSMEAATAALAARLAAKGGTDKDWELLAQSYDFMGRSAQAQQARQHKVSPQGSLEESVMASAWLLDGARQGGAAAPSAAAGAGKSAALLAKAEEHRRKREFKQACDTYRKVIAVGGMNADAWADYADALASTSPSGSLKGEPGKAIDQALALDPRHTKALWLKASLAHEERRYADALVAWRQLLALIPANSSDARIVEANMAEAARLAGGKG